MLAFGPFQLDPDRREFLRDGEPLPVQAKLFDTLVYLVDHRDRVVEKHELLDSVWPNIHVDESTLFQTVSALRKVLGCGKAGGIRYIATIPGQGYRFVAATEPTRPGHLFPVGQESQAPRFKLVGTTMVVVAALALAGYLLNRNANLGWAREEALPEIDRLAEEGRYVPAFALAEKAEAIIPNDPVLAELWGAISTRVSILSTPSGANVYLREYDADDANWRLYGTTPLEDLRVPRTAFRTRLTKAGFADVEGAFDAWLPPTIHSRYLMDEEGSIPEGMVRVPKGGFTWPMGGIRGWNSEPLEDYLIDRYEVTNRQFKAFVDAGGYEKREYWKQPFVREGRELSWAEAIALFHDRTGRPGPAGWELGDYPEGEDDYPVGGVSWYEAAAYARFADKTLPTIYHWSKAASLHGISYMAPKSNIFTSGPVPVGSLQGVSAYGLYDTAGNVREWCWNASDQRGRFLLGGGFADRGKQSVLTMNSFDRSPANGFRSMRNLSVTEAGDPRWQTVSLLYRDYRKEKPVSDEVFAAYRSLFSYDEKPLNAVIEGEEERGSAWVRQKVSFDAAYGDERVVAYLYLPRNVKPPYQTVIFFPGSYAVTFRTFDPKAQWRREVFDFIIKSGRALVYPVYKETYERSDGLPKPVRATNADKRLRIEAVNDVSRSIDYLETREDIDVQSLAYYGFSTGARFGPLMAAVENRIKTAVLYSGGFRFNRPLPMVDELNFAPRVRVPVLMVNGRFDNSSPLDSSQRPMFELLGTPAQHKRHAIYEAWHFVPRDALVRETLDWLDRYQGAVN